MIIFPTPGDYHGGSVHSSLLLVEELARRGRDVALVFHGSGVARDLARARGLRSFDFPAPGGSHGGSRDGLRLRDILSAPAARRVIKERGVRLVHVNDRQMLRSWALPTRASAGFCSPIGAASTAPSWSVDFGLRLASRVISVSQYGQALLPAWVQAKSDVVYNPFRPVIDIAERPALRRAIRSEAGIPEHAAVIGLFGSLLERKRPHVLLRILRDVRETADGRPVYGIACGGVLEPRDERYFAMLAEGAWNGRVVAPGHVENVGAWMAACDVLIAPAIEEAFGRVGVEAQSAGVPVLVSSDAGLREVVADGISGFVIDPDDYDAWLAATRRVLDDPDVARRLSDGGLAAAAALSVDRHVDAVEAIYDRLLQQPPHGGARR